MSDTPAPVAQPLSAEEEAAFRSRIDDLTVGRDDQDVGPGPWHAEGFTPGEGIGGWFDNATGDSSFPDVDDVALLLNEVPRLLATLDAARSVPSDRPASGLTDPDNAALETFMRGAAAGAKMATPGDRDSAQTGRGDDPVVPVPVPDNAALRESIETLYPDGSLYIHPGASTCMAACHQYDRRVLRAALAAAPASPSGSSPVAAGLDVERLIDDARGAPLADGEPLDSVEWNQGFAAGMLAIRWAAALASPADPEEAGR